MPEFELVLWVGAVKEFLAGEVRKGYRLCGMMVRNPIG